MDELQPLLAGRIARFAERLRAATLPADAHAVLLFTRSLAELRSITPESIYWAGRLCFVKRLEHLEIYEREFIAFMRESQDEPIDTVDSDEDQTEPAMGGEPTTASDAPLPEGDDDASVEITAASPVQILRSKSFSEVSADEAAQLKRLVAQIRTVPPRRTTRRTRTAPSGEMLDLGRMLRESVRTEGDPVRRRYQQRTKENRRLVFLLDVSGSMKAYSRSLLQFAYALRRSHGATEVFCFGTSLTRVTRQLDAPDLDRALRATGLAIPDWEGGTRISDSLKEFIDRWGRRGLARGAVIVMCSDGLERGDPQELAHQMARLRRLANSIVWLNPLKGAAGYEPLARGMSAALPYIDTFMPGHNLASLEELSGVLAGIGAGR